MNLSFSTISICIYLLGHLLLAPAMAQPVQLSESAFLQQTAELPTVIEDFNAMPVGTPDSPLPLANGLFVGVPQIIDSAWCLFSPCLATSIADARFENLPANTTHWSARLLHASSGNVLQVTVVGNNGTQIFTLPPGAFVAEGIFVGFHDPSGLRELHFEIIQGSLNYSFDDVLTAGPTGNPEPMSVPVGSPLTLGLLALILVGIAWWQFGNYRRVR